MRSIWLIFGGLLAGLLGLGFYLSRPATGLAAGQPRPAATAIFVSERRAGPATTGLARPDSIVRFALRQVGIPYLYAGSSPATGFDCSGFLQYVFGHFGVATPHSTALLIDAGQPVPRAQAQPGDIVVFTGTAEGSTTPGHAGIVISARGETPLRFVHASSARRESGVKISQVENSGYERRFMQVRRVLNGGPLRAASAPAPLASRSPTLSHTPARLSGAVATLPAARPALLAAPVAPLPAKLVPLPSRLHKARRPAVSNWSATAKAKKPAPATRSPHKASQKLAPAKKPVSPINKRHPAKTKTH